jgi:Fe2+ transport system protein FeoA
MKLWDLKPNQEGTILKIEKSCTCCDRLSSYGFIPGQTAKYLYKTSLGGPRVYLLNDTVYSLSHKVASQILIQNDLV